jgi:hypothetical protein
MAKDIVPDLIRQVLEMAGADLTIATRIEPRIRQQFGGERHYFAKAPAGPKAQGLASLVASGVPVGEACTIVGVSRSWGFQLLNRRTRRWPLL